MDGKCFALNGGNCSALTIPRCTGRCKFYKTSAQLRAERNDSYRRLVKLCRYDLIDKYGVTKE